MTTFTIHADEALADALRASACEAGLSINAFIKDKLANALGLLKTPRKDPSFMRFAGTLSSSDAAEMKRFVKQVAFSQIDEEMWK